MLDFAPPAAPLLVSASEAASGYVLIRLPAGWVGEAHPSPDRQVLFCLKGSMDVFTSTGEKRRISAGDIWLMADTSGKGHRTVVIDGPVDAAIVRLAKGGEAMNFGLTSEQEMVVSTVRSFVENELYPLEAEVERTGEVPAEVGREIMRKVQELGFYAPNIPEEFGGGGLDHLTFTLLERELGRASYGAVGVLGPAVQHPVRLQRGAAGALSAAGRARREDRLPRHDRARGGLRRALDEDHRAARRRRLRDQRHQALHQPRRPRRLRDRVRGDRQRGDQGGHEAADHLLPGRPGHARASRSGRATRACRTAATTTAS